MAPGRTGSLETLRRLNRLRVIHALRDEGLISRAEIARRTGLSRSTVSSLVSELQADGLVVERPEPAAAHGDQGGRPPILLSFDASAGVAVGIDFDHHHVRVAVSDLSSRILAEREQSLDTDHLAHEGLDAAAELVGQVLAEAGLEPERVIGAGMCLRGRSTARPASSARRRSSPAGSASPPPTRCTAASTCRSWSTTTPTWPRSPRRRSARGVTRRTSIYLMISSGIGAGLVLNGRLYRGAEGLAGELGHVLVDADGPVCRCGNRGCLETVAGTDALAELLRRSHGEGLDGRAIVRLAREGDLGCRRVIADAGRAIGKAAAMLVNVLNPELLIVGGDLAEAGELLLDGVRESLGRSALPTAAQAATVVAGSLGDRAEVLGAIALVLSEAERDHPLRPLAEAGAR